MIDFPGYSVVRGSTPAPGEVFPSAMIHPSGQNVSGRGEK